MGGMRTEVSRELLLAHKIPGVRGRYLDDAALWKQLLADQGKVSRKLLQLFSEAGAVPSKPKSPLPVQAPRSRARRTRSE